MVFENLFLLCGRSDVSTCSRAQRSLCMKCNTNVTSFGHRRVPFRPQTDTQRYFFPGYLKQEACEEPNPNHLNKLWCFKGVPTSLKQGETSLSLDYELRRLAALQCGEVYLSVCWLNRSSDQPASPGEAGLGHSCYSCNSWQKLAFCALPHGRATDTMLSQVGLDQISA